MQLENGGGCGERERKGGGAKKVKQIPVVEERRNVGWRGGFFVREEIENDFRI